MARPSSNTKLIALGVTAVAVVIAAVALPHRSGRPSASDSQPTQSSSEPENTIIRMITAATEGDLDGYLNCFQGSLRTTLAQRLETIARKSAAAELQNSERELNRFVTKDCVASNETEATLVLERGYSDYVRRDHVRLVKVEGNWKIAELKPLDQFAPRIPYGTPVAEPIESSTE